MDARRIAVIYQEYVVAPGLERSALLEELRARCADVNMEPGHDLGMRFVLLPDQGYKPSHTYLIRVVQTGGKAERILAQGELRLE